MKKLRVASCQFPVTEDIERNADYIGRYMQKAAAAGAHLLHTSETCFSGYAGMDCDSFTGYDWDQVRWQTTCLRDLAAVREAAKLTQAEGVVDLDVLTSQFAA